MREIIKKIKKIRSMIIKMEFENIANVEVMNVLKAEMRLVVSNEKDDDGKLLFGNDKLREAALVMKEHDDSSLTNVTKEHNDKRYEIEELKNEIDYNKRMLKVMMLEKELEKDVR